MKGDGMFFIGLLGGVVLSLTVRAVWLEWMPRPHPLDHSPKRTAPESKAWGLTRNFLYYDGTVMPQIKEDVNE